VDTLFIRSLGITSEEVSGGCFCCNYNDLEKSIKFLQRKEQPEVIFAESVGSCADLAATVINPLLCFNPDQYEIVLSVYADIRLLIKFLQNKKDIFYNNVNYIFEKQLQEADIVVVNKIDLLTDEQLKIAKKIIAGSYEGKTILYQNSLSEEGIRQWLFVCNSSNNSLLRPTLEIDYELYGAGEAELAWLDEEIQIVTTDKSAVTAGSMFINKIYNKITEYNHPIGHLKFLIDNGKEKRKISFSSIPPTPNIDDLNFLETDKIIILINARVQVIPALLQKIVVDAIKETEFSANCKIIENGISVFKPGYPRPTYKIPA
jgi:ethanolamine utilization protein EutP (predicted NTPase)